ncbi:MAG: hypothetical protein QOF70_2521, partial [Acetobacteraceae bacterium]|nr:hypothetical protein [Acetobacteraceae bacterium]
CPDPRALRFSREITYVLTGFLAPVVRPMPSPLVPYLESSRGPPSNHLSLPSSARRHRSVFIDHSRRRREHGQTFIRNERRRYCRVVESPHRDDQHERRSLSINGLDERPSQMPSSAATNRRSLIVRHIYEGLTRCHPRRRFQTALPQQQRCCCSPQVCPRFGLRMPRPTPQASRRRRTLSSHRHPVRALHHDLRKRGSSTWGSALVGSPVTRALVRSVFLRCPWFR